MADHQAAVIKFVQDNPTKISAIEQVLIPLGYVVPVDPLPSNDRRLIFATTHETGPNQLGGWDKYERSTYNSGNAQVSIAELSNAKSGRYALKTQISGYGTNGCRIFVLNDWSSGTKKPLPDETFTTFWAYLPKSMTGMRWQAIFQWKQTNSTDRAFNEPTLVLEWGSSTTYLRIHNKGNREGDYTNQTIAKFPIAKWVKIEVHAKHSTTAGFFHVWQDGVKILSSGASPVKTMRANGYNKLECSLLNYGEINGQTSLIYFDDFSLETPR